MVRIFFLKIFLADSHEKIFKLLKESLEIFLMEFLKKFRKESMEKSSKIILKKVFLIEFYPNPAEISARISGRILGKFLKKF